MFSYLNLGYLIVGYFLESGRLFFSFLRRGNPVEHTVHFLSLPVELMLFLFSCVMF